MVCKIILIGYMGVGKSTIGKELAKKTKLPFLDLDKIIEKKENKSIDELFQEKGELYFRKLEHHLFKELLSNQNSFVLSTGGGTPCYYNNHLLFELENIKSIYLVASIDIIFERLLQEKQERPIIKDLAELELKEFIGKHFFERSYYYQKATVKIKIDNKNVIQIVEEISELLF